MINGFLCSTKGISANEAELNDATWEKIVKILHEKGIGKHRRGREGDREREGEREREIIEGEG